jgi:ribonuclease-3
MIADAFEATIAAIFLDQGLSACHNFFAKALFSSKEDKIYLDNWLTWRNHPLQQGRFDRDQIPNSPVLQKLTKLESQIGIAFRHVKLLAQAFTHPSVGHIDTLNVGNYQRLEFLGDSILQMMISHYLYMSFPEHQEGQLTVREEREKKKLHYGVFGSKIINTISLSLFFFFFFFSHIDEPLFSCYETL